MSRPRTEAGRQLLAMIDDGLEGHDDRIVAIEREAVAQEPWREAVTRAATTLARPHKHWRPDLVQCGVEQDALSILRALLAQEVVPDPA